MSGLDRLERFSVAIEDHVATVTMRAPPVNAQDRRFREEIVRIFDVLHDTPEVRAVVLTGEGRAFSAGADLRERPNLSAEPGGYPRHNRLVRQAFDAVMECGKPVIATARRITGPELHRMNAVSACVPRQRLMEEAMGIAREIAAKSPLAVEAAKRSFGLTEEMPLRDGYRYEQSQTVALSRTEDTKEAQRAFAEKRKPVFKGR